MKDCLGPKQCTMLCVAFEKQGPSFWTRFNRFLNKWCKAFPTGA